MERTAGDPKSAEADDKSAGPGDKGAVDCQKSTGADDKGAADISSESDQKRGVEGSGCGDKSLSSGSDDKRVPPVHTPPHEAGVGRSASDDNKRGSGSRSAEREAPPRSRLNANAPEFIPRARAPPVTPPPARVDATGQLTSPAPGHSVRTPSPSPTPTTPLSIGSASPSPARSSSASPSPDRSSSRPQPRPRQQPMQGFSAVPRVDAITSPPRSPSVRTPSPSSAPTGSASPSPPAGGSLSRPPHPRPRQQPMQGFSAVAKHGSAVKFEMDKHKQQMLQYLDSADCDFYHQAANLGRKLTVDFEDLLQKNGELAIQICNKRGSNTTWLNEACKTFFESKQLPSDGVTFEFANMPSRLRKATDFMQSKECTEGRSICSNISYVEIATEHGRNVTDLILNRVLDEVADDGISWDGTLVLEDLLFGETVDGQVKVYITKRPVHKSPAGKEPRLRDLKSIWTMIKDGCRLDESNLPLYFLELKNDLQNALELSDWLVQYLRFHPALYASTPRRYFITNIQQTAKRLKLITDTNYGSLLTIQPLLSNDWRSIANYGPLNELLNYETNNSNSPKRYISYDNRYGSLLDYVKNGLSHLAQYISVTSDEEVELYLAQNFPMLLPYMMKGILRQGGMQDKFVECWEVYCKSK